MRLIITRHGETQGNVKRILADDDDKLTSRGIEQAKCASKALKHEKIDAIYTSPILRTKETAKIIAKEHPNSKFIIADELKEVKLGSYLYKKFDEVDWINLPPDVENRTSMFKRGKKIVLKAFRQYPKGTVLFVSHNALNKAIIRFLRGLKPEDQTTRIPQNNTAISIYEVNKKRYKEVTFNNTKHLR